jgi:hypothetical protein
LASHTGVSDSGHESVFGGVEFVFVLEGQSLAGEIVGFTLASSSELGLETFEVSVVLVDLYENH